MIKYLVIPGYVKSKNDGVVHWITAAKLIRLYGVDPRECWVAHAETPVESLAYFDLIHLLPRYNGNYDVRD